MFKCWFKRRRRRTWWVGLVRWWFWVFYSSIVIKYSKGLAFTHETIALNLVFIFNKCSLTFISIPLSTLIQVLHAHRLIGNVCSGVYLIVETCEEL
jgi:hypothetical protein